MTNREIALKMLQDGRPRTAQAWAAELGIKRHFIYNAAMANALINKLVIRERIKETSRMPIAKFLKLIKAEYELNGKRTMTEWAEILGIEVSQTRSIFARNNLYMYSISEGEKDLHLAFQKLNLIHHQLPAKSFSELSRLTGIADYVLRNNVDFFENSLMTTLVIPSTLRRKLAIKENPNKKTLGEWAKEFNMGISALSHFCERNNLRHLLK